MERPFTVSSAAGVQRAVTLLGFPDQCPRCHHRLVPKSLAVVGRTGEDKAPVEEVFQCTHGRCEGIFIGSYERQFGGASRPRYSLKRLMPIEAATPALPDTVRELSPTFLETYTQALAAESHNLNQLTGIGLRKALEFLIKDFAIHLDPDHAETIRGKLLGVCIREHIEDTNLKATAERAVWLGNDETHYVRRWEDKDIADLKVLIRLAINWTDNVLLTRRYLQQMPEGRK